MVLDDGTGQIECRIFIDSTNATETAHAIQKRATVRLTKCFFFPCLFFSWFAKSLQMGFHSFNFPSSFPSFFFGSRESPGVYVRVFGSVRVLGSRRLVNCLDYQIITDMNEVTFHMLECIYIHNFHTKGPVPVSLSTIVLKPFTYQFNALVGEN